MVVHFQQRWRKWGKEVARGQSLRSSHLSLITFSPTFVCHSALVFRTAHAPMMSFKGLWPSIRRVRSSFTIDEQFRVGNFIKRGHRKLSMNMVICRIKIYRMKARYKIPWYCFSRQALHLQVHLFSLEVVVKGRHYFLQKGVRIAEIRGSDHSETGFRKLKFQN